MSPTDNQKYQIRKQQAINETLGEETIILNLETGVYYSLNGTATLVWKGIDSCLETAEILLGLTAKYPGTPGIEGEVLSFLQFLESESLIEKTVDPSPAGRAFAESLAAEAGAYAPPLIEKYEDMTATLLADPIHEVEPDGWPRLKKNEPA